MKFKTSGRFHHNQQKPLLTQDAETQLSAWHSLQGQLDLGGRGRQPAQRLRSVLVKATLRISPTTFSPLLQAGIRLLQLLTHGKDSRGEQEPW